MNANEFDRVIRDRLSGVTEAAPDVWEGISSGLARRHRRVVMRRFATGAVAAAAGLALALLVFRDRVPEGIGTAPVRIARAVAAPEAPETSAPVQDVAPIATQIAHFTKQQTTASARVVKPAVPASAEQPTVAEPVVAEPVVAEPVVSEPVEPAAPAEDKRLTEDQLPADFWDNPDPAEPRSRTHTSIISLHSNLSAVASENSLLYEASPMHASSQTGGQAVSRVEPFSESPKFYAPLSLGLQLELPLAGRLSAVTGLSYSYLVSRYDILVDKVRYEDAYNQLHYLGIPLTLSYRFVETPTFGFYASAGGAVEKCVAQRYVYANNTLSEKVGGLQWSARVGLGAEYWFVPRLGLYFDPSLVYYFDNNQPLSIRTQQPVQARFEVGLRFKL